MMNIRKEAAKRRGVEFEEPDFTNDPAIQQFRDDMLRRIDDNESLSDNNLPVRSPAAIDTSGQLLPSSIVELEQSSSLF